MVNICKKHHFYPNFPGHSFKPSAAMCNCKRQKTPHILYIYYDLIHSGKLGINKANNARISAFFELVTKTVHISKIHFYSMNFEKLYRVKYYQFYGKVFIWEFVPIYPPKPHDKTSIYVGRNICYFLYILYKIIVCNIVK